MSKIPPSIIGVSGTLLAERYTHSDLDSLFLSAGFPGDPPEGNKVTKCQHWMRAANNAFPDALARFGRIISEFMEEDGPQPFASWTGEIETQPDPRDRLREALGREGLTYMRGGNIIGTSIAGPSRSLAERLQTEGIGALEEEYRRAYAHVEADPPAAVTAACAILESLCKTFLETEGAALPSKQALGPLWAETSKHLGLQPGQLADDDLKRILQGLAGVADGIAALRTHEGSAHGRSGLNAQGKPRYRLQARHARLAVHSAHTMALFVLETWEERRGK